MLSTRLVSFWCNSTNTNNNNNNNNNHSALGDPPTDRENITCRATHYTARTCVISALTLHRRVHPDSC